MSAGKFNLTDNGDGTSAFEIETLRGKGRKRTIIKKISTNSDLAKKIRAILEEEEEENRKLDDTDIECMEFLVGCLDYELSKLVLS